MVNSGLPATLEIPDPPPPGPLTVHDPNRGTTFDGECRHTRAVSEATGRLHAQIAVALLRHVQMGGTVTGSDTTVAALNGTPVTITIEWTAEIPPGGIHREDDYDASADLGC